MLLVLVTLVFLASIGGGMVLVWWALVPLHWMAARRSGPFGTAGWALLAGASVGEAVWIITYALSQEAGIALAVGGTSAAVTAVSFIAARSRTVRTTPA